MKFNEWDKVIKYATKACKKCAHNTLFRVYTMYDGRKGIQFTLFDSLGNEFAFCNTGCQTTYAEFKNAIDTCISRLKEV